MAGGPAIVLGLQLADAPVIRSAGGRVAPAVVQDIAYLSFLAEQLFGGEATADTLFEVAVTGRRSRAGHPQTRDLRRADFDLVRVGDLT